MVFRPVSISSEKPFNCARLADLFLKRGRTVLLRRMVIITEIGRVIYITPSKAGEVAIMPKSAPATEIMPVAAWSISFEREALTVSIS